MAGRRVEPVQGLLRRMSVRINSRQSEVGLTDSIRENPISKPDVHRRSDDDCHGRLMLLVSTPTTLQ